MVRRRVVIWSGAVLLALGAAPGASAGGGGCGEVTSGEGTTVELLYACITPSLIRVDPGETVTFVNRDSFRHVITGAGYAWGSRGYMGEGETFTATFRRAGVYPFQCYLHPGMVGAVLVGDANGPGAATDGRVRVAPVAPSPSPSPVVATTTLERQVFVTEPVERAALLAMGAGLLLAGFGAAALRRARRRNAVEVAIDPAERAPALR